MNALHVSHALAQFRRTRDVLDQAKRDLSRSATSILGATFDPEDDRPLDLAARLEAGAATVIEELDPLIALLDKLSSLAADPTEAIDLDEDAQAELAQAAVLMKADAEAPDPEG